MTTRPTNAIRVLIVDDSAVARGALGRVIDAEHDMYVATTATNGRDALDALRQQPVDVVLLDIDMPVMDGLTALPLILASHPQVSVLMTSSLATRGGTIAMRALSLGAVDYVHKPSSRGVGGVDAAAAEITAKVRVAAAHVKVRAGGGLASGSGNGSNASNLSASSRGAPARPIASSVASSVAGQSAIKPRLVGAADFEPRILALAASTGGPNAIATVISQLGGDFPLPVVVTQHMPPIFTTMFAQRLDRQGQLRCEEASDGATLVPGHVYVAPGDHHLTVTTSGAGRLPAVSINRDAPEHHCRPAADPMFRSLARSFGSGVLAVVLTGMGEDGRRGCDMIVRSGGRVVVQDEATSVVWGMPGSVVNSGIPCTVLPLDSIAAYVTSLCPARS